MSVGRICIREVSVADPDETVAAAARRMQERDVGSLVVVDGEKHPVGLLTDRDIALRCVAAGKDPGSAKVSSIMSAPAVSVHEGTAIETALERMAGVHTRRLVVVDDRDQLVGILAMDDVAELLLEEASSLARILSGRPHSAAKR